MIANDQSGHDYIIPCERREEWDAWLYSEDWKAGVAPIYAMRLEGNFTFTDPRITYGR